MTTSSIASWLLAPVETAAKNRSLIFELARREVQGRYRGANFGLLWAIISPFLMLAVYAMAFGSILKSRWPQTSQGGHSFTLILFVGLIIHSFFAECLSRSPQLVVGNPNYVKRVIFPLEVLPWPMVLSALFHLFANLIAFIVLEVLLDRQLVWSIILFPITIAPLVVLSLGVAWWLAALGVYFRDISQITGVMVTALLFTSTAIMPLSAVSPSFRLVFELNPLTFIIDQSRSVVLWGELPNWIGLGVYLLGATIFAFCGYCMFAAVRRGFSDVI